MTVEDTSTTALIRRRWNALTQRLFSNKYATKEDIERLREEVRSLRKSVDAGNLHAAVKHWQDYERSIGGRGY